MGCKEAFLFATAFLIPGEELSLGLRIITVNLTGNKLETAAVQEEFGIVGLTLNIIPNCFEGQDLCCAAFSVAPNVNGLRMVPFCQFFGGL